MAPLVSDPLSEATQSEVLSNLVPKGSEQKCVTGDTSCCRELFGCSFYFRRKFNSALDYVLVV
jgi:hypothetical protein